MNKNWIVFVFALLALASCSVEKRVYQPGYHIEWNHYAKQDAEQDASRDVAQDAERDASQDLSENLSKNLSENLETDVSQDLSENLSENFETDASQDLPQDLPQDLSENLETDASQDLPQDLSENLETFVSQGTGQSIDSDLELILLIILALFLPALTIFLLEGFSKNFWIALLLMAVAYLLPFSSFITRGLIVAIATILAIAVVFHYL
jgi:uncharacterized membrane protein YqaE (UPF0057 family)